MITKAMIQRLEKKFIKIRNAKGGGSVVLRRDTNGKYKELNGRLLTDDEVNSISKDCRETGKQLICVDCWTVFKDEGGDNN